VFGEAHDEVGDRYRQHEGDGQDDDRGDQLTNPTHTNTSIDIPPKVIKC